MSMFKERMFKKVAEEYKILNDNLIVRDNTQELIDVILGIIRNIPVRMVIKTNNKNKKAKNEERAMDKIGKISYISHRLRYSNEEERCKDILRDLYRKNNTDKFYINVREERLLTLEIDIMMAPSMFKQVYRESIIANTKYILLEKIRSGETINTSDEIVNEVLTSNFTPQFKDNNYMENLIYTYKFYIPINDRGYYQLGGKYYNGYFLKPKFELTSKGKMKIDNDSFISFMREDNGRIIHDVFKKSVNPFIYMMDLSEKHLIEYFEADVSEKDLEMIYNTYMDRLNVNPIELEEWKLSKWFTDIEPSLIMESMKIFCVERNKPQDAGAVHLGKYNMLLNGTAKNLYIEIRKYIPKFFKNSPEKSRKNFNPHAYTLPTLIKMKSRQYPSFDGVNEHDIFKMLNYTKTHKKSVKADERKFYIEEYGILDPVSSPGTKNVGLSGAVVPSLDDGLIVLK